MQAFKSISQEMSRILDVVGCYAVYKPEVGFTVKKQASCLPTLVADSWDNLASWERHCKSGCLGRREKQGQTCTPSQDRPGQRTSGAIIPELQAQRIGTLLVIFD